jgi:HEAT repeat protein
MVPFLFWRFSQSNRSIAVGILICFWALDLVPAGYGKADKVEALIRQLKDPRHGPEVRCNAAAMLGKTKDPRAVDPLIVALGDKSPYVRQNAAKALGEIQSPRAIEFLFAALADPDSDVQQNAAEALVLIRDPRVVDFLIAILKAPGPVERKNGAEELARINDLRAVDPLAAALKDTNSGVRAAAAYALSVFSEKAPTAIDPLITAMNDTDFTVRSYVARALGKSQDPRAIKPLIAAISDTNRQVRDSAVRAIASIKDPRVSLILAEIAEDEHESATVRGSVVGMLTDQAVLAKIQSADKDDNVREAAEITLAALQTANLSTSDRVKANWPKLRKGMPFSAVEKLIGPFPDEVRENAGWSALLGSLNGGPISTSNSITTDLFVLKFDNLNLVGWQLK